MAYPTEGSRYEKESGRRSFLGGATGALGLGGFCRNHAVDMANVHCAAATENFLVMENHSVDVPWWGDLVSGVEKPIVNKGFIVVPDEPGLGITLNEDVVKQHLAAPDAFEPTTQWDTERSNDRLWS